MCKRHAHFWDSILGQKGASYTWVDTVILRNFDLLTSALNLIGAGCKERAQERPLRQAPLLP